MRWKFTVENCMGSKLVMSLRIAIRSVPPFSSCACAALVTKRLVAPVNGTALRSSSPSNRSGRSNARLIPVLPVLFVRGIKT
jgi:hypothetical protein